VIFVHLYLSDFCLPECEVQGQVLGRHCEEEDAEDNGNLLVDVLFLPKIQSGRLQPSEGKKKEDLVQHGQVVHVGHVVVLHEQKDRLHAGVQPEVEDVEVEEDLEGQLAINPHSYRIFP